LTRAYVYQYVEDDQAEIRSACVNYFLQFFKAMDEDAKGKHDMGVWLRVWVWMQVWVWVCVLREIA